MQLEALTWKVHLSAFCLSQVSLSIHQCHPQYDRGKPWPPIHSKDRAYPWDSTSCEGALGRSSLGASSSRNSSTGPRAWRGQQSPLFNHHISTTLRRRLISSTLWLYHRFQQRLFVSTQSLPDHPSHPLIGQPTALLNTHHTDIHSPQGERPQQ